MLHSARGRELCKLARELIKDLKKENPNMQIRGLTRAETNMFFAAARGGNAECSFGGPTLESDSEWGCWETWDKKDRLIRAEVLRWLCTTAQALALVHPRGIHIRDALIKGVCRRERAGDLDIDLDDAKLPFSFYLWKCAIPGGIQLREAEIGHLLALRGCHTKEVRIDRIKAQSHVWLRNAYDENSDFQAKEKVSGNGAQISGDLHLGGSKIPSLIMSGAIVGGTLNLQDATIEDIDFSSSCISSLEVSQFNRPVKGKLHLKGLRYKAITSLTDAHSCLEWLRLQPADDLYSPQPYEQLAGMLREMGHRSDAKSVLYEADDMLMKRDRRRWYRKPSLKLILWTLFLGYVMHPLWKWIAGYGHYPWRAFLGIIVFCFIGWGVFAWSYSEKIMYENKQPPDLRPQFVPLVYSLDVLLPVIDFGEESYWRPSVKSVGKLAIKNWEIRIPIGKLVFYYQVIHIMAGYVLTIAFLAALSGFFSRSK